VVWFSLAANAVKSLLPGKVVECRYMYNTRRCTHAVLFVPDAKQRRLKGFFEECITKMALQD
jgi:hypothetical protein